MGDWLEGYLFDRRVASLAGPLDDAAATRLATQLMTLDAIGDNSVSLRLDSSGGPLSAAFTLVDVIESLGVPVHVLCMGRIECSAVAVAAACSKRTALPHTQFAFGDPEVSFEAPASESEALARSELDLVGRYHQVLARCTGQPLESIVDWCGRRRRLDAAAAFKAGIIDEVAVARGKLRPVR
jgi:ATP-dependent Clp protease protease subunit